MSTKASPGRSCSIKAEASWPFQLKQRIPDMRNNGWTLPLILVALLQGAIAVAQANPESRTLVVNGKSGATSVVQFSNRTFIDLESLVRIGNGSLGFQGNKITLTFPDSPANTAAVPAPPEQPASRNGLSQNFMMAGIESIAQMREWASAMAYAIQNGYGVTDAWASDYREKAASSLRQASAAASTEGDRSALQLLSNEFDSVGAWSNKLVEAKKAMDTAKYSTSPNALRDEPLSQKIVQCGHFLSKMLGSAQFADDTSCH